MNRMPALALLVTLILVATACDSKDRPSQPESSDPPEQLEGPTDSPLQEKDQTNQGSSDETSVGLDGSEPPLEEGEIRIVRDLKDRGPMPFRFIPDPNSSIHASWTLEVDGERYGLQDIADQADEQVLLTVEDMNGDGVDDFRVLADQPASLNLPYHYFIWSSQDERFALNEALASITTPQFIQGEIRSFWRDGAAIWGNNTFVWDEAENGPVLIREETWDATDEDILATYGDGYARYRKTEYNPETGEPTMTLDQAEMVE